MKQGLQARLQQQLTLTPQLQQAIHLLQVSTLELGAELRQLAETNPLLDIEDLGMEPGAAETEPQAAPAADPDDKVESFDDAEADLPLSFERTGSASGPGPARPSQDIETGSHVDLYRHLMWQLDVTTMPARQRAIVAALIDAVDEDGYLRADNEEIRQALGDSGALDDKEIDAARTRLQAFDPTGVGSRTLGECLNAQLLVLDTQDPNVRLAQRIAADGLDLLARNDLAELARQLDVEPERLPPAVELIHSLAPKPGLRFDSTPPEYVVPDAYAVKRNGSWQVSLSPDCLPRIELNQHYCALIGQSKGNDARYLRTQLQEARWLIKSLESRADTIFKVAKAIVAAQRAFLDFGPQAMRPLVLREVAETIDMHESTVSRVTTRKYLHTPRGIFEFKSFFSSAVGTEDGGSASATAIQATIRQLVQSENRAKPYSDEALVKALREQGIQVARRTVAKYRKAMRIPNSSQRVHLDN